MLPGGCQLRVETTSPGNSEAVGGAVPIGPRKSYDRSTSYSCHRTITRRRTPNSRFVAVSVNTPGGTHRRLSLHSSHSSLRVRWPKRVDGRPTVYAVERPVRAGNDRYIVTNSPTRRFFFPISPKWLVLASWKSPFSRSPGGF